MLNIGLIKRVGEGVFPPLQGQQQGVDLDPTAATYEGCHYFYVTYPSLGSHPTSDEVKHRE